VVDGVHRFLRIPYADMPFGDNRFRAPVARASWTRIFPADSYGFACPQAELVQPGTPELGEDCLNLNLWTPDPAAEGLPVMVWAHGGDQDTDTGSGSLPLYDGSHFARDGVVLVTCNRRLHGPNTTLNFDALLPLTRRLVFYMILLQLSENCSVKL
jgi:para-nitrobenzyl esterase